MGNGLLEQPLEYEVYYNGTRENVTSPTTMLIFPAPSLPDGVFVDNITVIVTAINRFGRGNSSDPPEYFEISMFHIHKLIATIYVQHLCTCVRMLKYKNLDSFMYMSDLILSGLSCKLVLVVIIIVRRY